MAHCLSSLTRLVDLQIQFESVQPRPDQPSRLLPPSTRAILPALTRFFFRGVIEYLEVLFARLDAPRLQLIDIGFLDPPIFDISRTLPFLGCTEPFKGLGRAVMYCENGFVEVQLSPQESLPGCRRLTLTFRSRNLVWYLPYFNQSSCRYTDARELEDERSPIPGDRMKNVRWLQTLTSFNRRGGSVPNREACAVGRTRPARDRQKTVNGGATCATKKLYRWTAAFRTYPGSHWGVCRCERALRSPGICPILERKNLVSP